MSECEICHKDEGRLHLICTSCIEKVKSSEKKSVKK